MRQIFKYITIILSLCIPTVSVSAAQTTAAIAFNPENGAVTVSGYSEGNTIIKTIPASMEESSVAADNLFTDIDQIYSGGDFTYTFYMPDGADYGKYRVYVIGNGKDDDTFMYYDPAAADSIIPTLNGQKTEALLEMQIDTEAEMLGIDKDEDMYISNSAKASEILFEAFMPFTNSTDFYGKFNACLAMAAMKNASKTETEALLLKYQQNLGINYTNDYMPVSEAIRTDLCKLLSEMNFSKELQSVADDCAEASFAKLFARIKGLSAVRTATSWSAIRDAFTTDYNEALGIIMADNSSYNTDMESSVFIKLAEEATFDSFSDLKTKFNNAVAAVKAKDEDNDKNASGSGGSKGGKGGSGGSRVSISSVYVNPQDEYEATKSGEDNTAVIPTSFTIPVLKEESVQYSDVNEKNWEYKAVSLLGGNGIISGYADGSFRSGNAISRAEFAKLIVSAFNIKAKASSFSDVSVSDWFYPYVSVAAGSGIVNGYEDRFNPDAQISREDAAVIIYRVATALGKKYSGTVNFADLTDVSIYALTAVRGLGNAKIVKGDENMMFNPQGQLTRAEAAQLLYNFIRNLAE